MSRAHILQQENAFNTEAKRILLQIKEIKPLKNYEIAEMIGVEYATLTRAKSAQIPKALNLLLDNLMLRARIEQIERAKRDLFSNIYSGGLGMNEPPVSYNAIGKPGSGGTGGQTREILKALEQAQREETAANPSLKASKRHGAKKA